MKPYNERVSDLQIELGEAKNRGDTNREIAILLNIGELAMAEGDYSLANMHFEIARRVISDSGASQEKLALALGQLALIARIRERFDRSLELYQQAVEAAREHAGPGEVAHLLGDQGAVLRVMDQPNLARAAFEEALALFTSLGDAGRAGVADQEGNLGLLAADTGNDREAARRYRLATELATAAGATDVAITWSTNLGNVYARQRRYSQAWDAYGMALEAAYKIGDEQNIRKVAIQWARGYRLAHQYTRAAETLLNAADQISRLAIQVSLRKDALSDLYIAGAYQQLLEIGNKVLAIFRQHGADQDQLANIAQLVDFAQDKLDQEAFNPTDYPDEPTILDGYIISKMSEYVERGDTAGMRDVAHLICDVNLALLNPSEEAWRPLLSESYLRYRVLGEVMLALLKEGKAEQSFELVQRFKSLGFCAPNLERLLETGVPEREAADYLTRFRDLSQAVEGLRGPAASPDGLQRVEAVRAAGELLLEAGVMLQEADPILHARMGGVVPLQGLIDALPTADPAALVDLFVTREGTLIHILRRVGGQVQIFPNFSPHFTIEHAGYLMQVWSKTNVAHEVSERQQAGLGEISKVLHDRLFCGLADQLSKLSVPQVILIPDLLTRHLPLHLAGVCAENVEHIIEHINIPYISSQVELFSEVFPVEYAPCVQAVAVSQHQKRPREVSAVLSLANPTLDLPGSQTTAAWMEKQLPGTLKLTSHVGAEATLTNLFAGLEAANVVIVGSHGYFDHANPLESHLVLNDGKWRMTEMLDQQPFRQSPVIVLSACEVGATAPTLDEMEASGIPGALLSSGAACVLASLWPVEDISMGYVVERFVTYLSYPGYRPAAALFRAVRDLRLLKKTQALERCFAQIEQMQNDGSIIRLPNEYLMLYNLVNRIEDSPAPTPFADPQWWGGIIVVGSGWARPAGAMVGPVEDVLAMGEDHITREKARNLLVEGKVAEAREMLEEILVYAEGMERARALDALAWAVWLDRKEGASAAAKKEALGILEQAEFVAQAEQDEQLLRNVKATRQKIELWEV